MFLPFLSLVLMERDETRTRCAVAVPIRTLSVALLPAQSTPPVSLTHKFGEKLFAPSMQIYEFTFVS
jgi:hypothetical protein